MFHITKQVNDDLNLFNQLNHLCLYLDSWWVGLKLKVGRANWAGLIWSCLLYPETHMGS